jgi:hypothetical protein
LDSLLLPSEVKFWEAVRSMTKKRILNVQDRTGKVGGSLQQPVPQ